MSIRIKVFLIITVIILAITASSVVISITSAQNEIITTLESGMQSVASVANEYISGEIDLLLVDAATAVQALKGIPTQNMHWSLMEQVAAFNDVFTAITIFNAQGRVEATYGNMPTPAEMADSEYGQLAKEGKRAISTSQKDPSGAVVFYVFVPMDEEFQERARSRIVAFTVPGDLLSKKVNQFNIWGSGKISLGDSDGVILASRNQDWVNNRSTYLDLVDLKKSPKATDDIVKSMIAGGTGAARYVFDSADSVTAFRPLTLSAGENPNWFIIVATQVAESAYDQVRRIIVISGLIFLGLGLLAAAFASGSVAKPFYQIRKQNVQLIELGEQVKAAAVAKTNFLANMSFDMRTPLNAVIGLSELSLTKKGVPADIRSYLDRIYGSGQKLMEVVSELLDISNMESGKFGVIPAEYDVQSFINDTANVNTVNIGSKPITFHIVPDGSLPVRLVGDSLRIRQIFNALLSNAFRYTSVGSVEWKLSAEKDGDGVWLVSSITDTGVGIKTEDLNKLFIDYNRVDNARVRNREGTSGLGLTLAKKIANLMDGTITVESTVGKGSTFTVRVRQKTVNDAVISPEAINTLKGYKYVEQKRSDKADLQRIQLPGKKVLVVDDIELNLEIAQGMLEPYGLKVDCLLNGKEAVELIRAGEPRYDAIFMSHWMTELDGKEAVRIIRSEIGGEYAQNIPIIALTSNTAIGNKDIFLAWGYQGILSKPLDIGHLDNAIHTWLAPKA